MAYTLAWGLIMVACLGIMLDAADRADRRRIADMDRRVAQAFRDAMDTPEGAPEPRGLHGNRPDMTNRSHRPQNAPEIAK